MLDHVTIKNFRCLREVSVDLKPLTVLIGENDTGKSTFLEAVARWAGTDSRTEFDRLDHWRQDFSNDVTLEAESDAVRWGLHRVDSYRESRAVYERRPAKSVDSIAEVRADRLQVDPSRILFRGEQMLPRPSRGNLADSLPDPAVSLDSDGSNTPAVLDYMLRSYRKRFDELEARCRALVPGFDEFSINLEGPGKLSLSYWQHGREYPTDAASAGVRALILYLTLAYRPDAPDIVLIEEPENGLHPKRLGEVMNLLRLLTEPKADGRRTQVILTTHSPFLLDHVRPDEDGILIFQRQADGSRTATPADWDRARVFLKHFSPGEIWFNRGEASLVPAPELDGADEGFGPPEDAPAEPDDLNAAAAPAETLAAT